MTHRCQRGALLLFLLLWVGCGPKDPAGGGGAVGTGASTGQAGASAGGGDGAPRSGATGTADGKSGESARGGGEAGKGGKGEPSGPPQPPRDVRVVQVSQLEIERTIPVIGTLAADEQATVGTKVPGRLESISIDLGSPVKKGQPIARIEATDYKLRVDQAESALAQARALLGLDPAGTDSSVEIDKTAAVREAQATLDEASAAYDRTRTLVEKGLIAKADLDTARTAFVRAQTGLETARDQTRNRQALLSQRRSELNLARQQLADTVIRAPIDGMVQLRQANTGEFLAAGAPVAIVVRVNPLRLRTEVPERDAATIRPGLRVRVSVEGDRTVHEGRLARIAPAISAESRVLVVEAEIENRGQLRPGSFARAEIVLDGAGPVPVVPASAVITFAGLEKIIVPDDGKAKEIAIRTGRRSGDWIEVIEGVKAGDPLVVEPGNLQQGQPITIVQQQGASSPAASPGAPRVD